MDHGRVAAGEPVTVLGPPGCPYELRNTPPRQQGATPGGPPTWASYVGQDKQYQATPAEEQSLGVPALAARFAADRTA